ncbi:tetratricopeptide repeat protein 1 [Fopius arisanus]|uniref:Tetratricopeptide repeat protein 1 n=1 Tax=Fopius arisanus TaxID=64838 RepID=A0A9R1TTR4_9HYME|nr:PREDICTED: tetratricopeptide repeat protein 1 [Fopius arisanus]
MEGKGDKVPSNEEILEDLTKDLEKLCVDRENKKSDDDEGRDGDFKVKPEEDPWEKVGKSSEENSEATEVNPQEAEDWVDEEALKDREVSLSEEEKEKLKAEAEELKNEGNSHFKSSEYREAMRKYTQALQTCPLKFEKDRAILYANRGAAKAKYDERISAIEDCSKAIELNSTYLKAYLRRGQLYEQENKLDESLADYKKILELDPHNAEANHAVNRLPPLIDQRNEKLKQEMLGKLKDLGNMILRPFGLSTENFKMEQDPSSGGYSVKFNQNPS